MAALKGTILFSKKKKEEEKEEEDKEKGNKVGRVKKKVMKWRPPKEVRNRAPLEEVQLLK